MMLLSIVVNAQNAVCVDGIYYNLNDEKLEAEVSFSPTEKYVGDVIIPDSVTYNENKYCVVSIGKNAFYNCVNLSSIKIPKSVMYIAKYAFDSCYKLFSVYISDLESWLKITFDSHPLFWTKHFFINGEEIKDLIIPNSVTSICDDAFYGCHGFTSVIIPNSVRSIGNRAFFGCDGLTSVIIPNSVTSIGDGAFENCSNLTSIILPNSVTRINQSTFESCKNLESITIPNSVTSIGEAAFLGCI